MKVAEICDIAHFLCENICDICLAVYMQDGKSAIGDLFTNCVLAVLNVSIGFCVHFMIGI